MVPYGFFMDYAYISVLPHNLKLQVHQMGGPSSSIRVLDSQ